MHFQLVTSRFPPYLHRANENEIILKGLVSRSQSNQPTGTKTTNCLYCLRDNILGMRNRLGGQKGPTTGDARDGLKSVQKLAFIVDAGQRKHPNET